MENRIGRKGAGIGAGLVAGPAFWFACAGNRAGPCESVDGNMSGTLDIYTGFFGLTGRPFSLLPDPDFLFWSPLHRRAFAMLEYGLLTRAPITLITGEVGAGKTTLLHHLIKSMDEDIRVALISNAQGGRGELLQWALSALDQPAPPDEGYVGLFIRFQTHVINEYAAGRRVVLVFDEAQNLGLENLEELRMFTNINSNKDELLQLVLVGQPELRAMVLRPELSQFAQRVAATYHLPAMTAEMVRGYIEHRLRVTGCREQVFDEEAVDLIFEATRGVPRLVNQLCDLSMVYAFTSENRQIGRAIVQQVIDDGAFFGGGLARPTPQVLQGDNK